MNDHLHLDPVWLAAFAGGARRVRRGMAGTVRRLVPAAAGITGAANVPREWSVG